MPFLADCRHSILRNVMPTGKGRHSILRNVIPFCTMPHSIPISSTCPAPPKRRTGILASYIRNTSNCCMGSSIRGPLAVVEVLSVVVVVAVGSIG